MVVAAGGPIAIEVCKILESQDIHARIIEPDEQQCRLLAEYFPKMTILNQEPTDLNFLLAEKVHLSDAFVACTGSNEKNILAAALAKQAGCSEVIAQVADESYASVLRRLGIYFNVSEKIAIANRIHVILEEQSVISVASLYHHRAKILEVKVAADSQIVGIPITDLSKYLPEDFLIALIENRGRIMIAKGSNIFGPWRYSDCDLRSETHSRIKEVILMTFREISRFLGRYLIYFTLILCIPLAVAILYDFFLLSLKPPHGRGLQ